ncbi:helix-turn-helix domain-containing protein [Flavobacterium cerinum]|uniref:helix-turn-helix domain-containing protein n=1 Tax=Flavobacterium cerinum TaxID=2502784 RepID=UPI0035318C2F
MISRALTKIRLSRLEKNYSQEYIASRLSISQSYYGRIENGKKEITLKCLLQILEILEIDLVTFFSQIKGISP